MKGNFINKVSCMKKLLSGLTAVVALSAVVIFFISACGSWRANREDPPIITSATYQHTLYNGKPQPLEAKASKENTAPFVITYFTSEENLYKNEGGTIDPPVEVGAYYARIERPQGNGYTAGPDVKVEYYIQKAFVTIQAEEKQEAIYDGSPKRVAFVADPPLDLSTAYFTSAQAREAAALPESEAGQRADALKGFTRVESAPKEPGLYYVTIYYRGDKSYRPSAKEIEFSIISRKK
jgi:hypothetical protein